MEDLSTLPPATPQKPYGQNKSWVIAFIVSAVFLLAAAGICFWLLTKQANATQTTQKPTGDGSESVKNVTWVAPTTLPASYVRRDQNTRTVATTYYFDVAVGCGITTTVQPVQTNVAVKQGVLDAAKASQSYGIATASSADAQETSVHNQDGKHTYKFQGLQLEQSVAVVGVPYTAQRTVIAFKQFGQQVATIGHSCRTDAWETKHAELQTFVNAFKVKTE